jgi:hypothetical protein
MSGRWFRLYDDLLNDPKVQRLSPKLFKALINLWCLASKNDGHLPPIEDVGYALRLPTEKAMEVLDILTGLGFFDLQNSDVSPHNWSKFQFKSDDGSERKRAYREKKAKEKQEPNTEMSRPCPVLDTEQRQNRTETEEEGASPPAARGPYAYSGKVVRLNPEDHSRWKASFSFLDLNSELEARDNWLAEQPAETRRRWFGSTSKYLANRNMEAKAKAQAPPKPNPTADGFNRAFARIRAHAAATSDREPTNVVDLSEVRRGGEGVSDPPCDVEPSNGCG